MTARAARWEACRKNPRTGEWSSWIGVTEDCEAQVRESGRSDGEWKFRTLYTGPSSSALQRALEEIAAEQSALSAQEAADRFQAIAREALATEAARSQEEPWSTP